MSTIGTGDIEAARAFLRARKDQAAPPSDIEAARAFLRSRRPTNEAAPTPPTQQPTTMTEAVSGLGAGIRSSTQSGLGRQIREWWSGPRMTEEEFDAGGGSVMREPDYPIGQQLALGAREGWRANAPRVFGGAPELPAGAAPGIGGLIGETGAGLVGGFTNPAMLAENTLGTLAGMKAVRIAGPALARVESFAGPRITAALANAIEGAAGNAPIAIMQAAEQIPDEMWRDNPGEALKEVLKAGGAGAALGAGVGAPLGVLGGRFEQGRPGTVPELLGDLAGVDRTGDVQFVEQPPDRAMVAERLAAQDALSAFRAPADAPVVVAEPRQTGLPQNLPDPIQAVQASAQAQAMADAQRTRITLDSLLRQAQERRNAAVPLADDTGNIREGGSDAGAVPQVGDGIPVLDGAAGRTAGDPSGDVVRGQEPGTPGAPDQAPAGVAQADRAVRPERMSVKALRQEIANSPYEIEGVDGMNRGQLIQAVKALREMGAERSPESATSPESVEGAGSPTDRPETASGSLAAETSLDPQARSAALLERSRAATRPEPASPEQTLSRAAADRSDYSIETGVGSSVTPESVGESARSSPESTPGPVPLRLRTDAFNRMLDAIDSGRPEAEIRAGIEAASQRLDSEQKAFLYDRAGLTQSPKVKEPWEMTRAEFGVAKKPVRQQDRFTSQQRADMRSSHRLGPRQREATHGETYWTIDGSNVAYKKRADAIERGHRDTIERALSEGKPVPPEVLADYPDLAQAPKNTPPEQPTKIQKDQQNALKGSGVAEQGGGSVDGKQLGQSEFMVPPLVSGMMDTARQSIVEQRAKVSGVRYGKPGEILFEYDGKTYSAKEPKDVLPVGAGEAGQAWAVRQVLDGDAKPVTAESKQGGGSVPKATTPWGKLREQADAVDAKADRLERRSSARFDTAPGAYVTGGSGRKQSGLHKRTNKAIEGSLNDLNAAKALRERASTLRSRADRLDPEMQAKAAERRERQLAAREAVAAKESAERKAAPIINEDAPGRLRLTREEWNRIDKDYKAIDVRNGVRVRTALRGGVLSEVFITDAKVVSRAQPSTSDKLLALADKIEAKAKARSAKRTIPRGRNTGAAINPIAEIRDQVAIVVAKAIRAGVTSGRALSRIVNETVSAKRQADVRRAARRILKAALDDNGGIDADRIETAIGQMYAAGKPAKSTKAQVLESTGQAKAPKTMTERDARTRGYKMAEKAGREAWRESRKAAQAEARAATQNLLGRIRLKREAQDTYRNEARKIVQQYLPKSVQGNLLTSIEKAKTIPMFLRAVDKVDRELARFEGKDAARQIIRLTKKKKLATLTNERRDAIKKQMIGFRSALEDVRKGDGKAAADAAALMKQALENIRTIYAEHRAETANIKGLRDMNVLGAKKVIESSLVKRKALPGAESNPDATEANKDGPQLGLGRRFIRNNMNVEQIAHDLDGTIGKDVADGKGGVAHTLLYDRIDKGQDAAFATMRDVQETINTIAQDSGAFKDLADARVQASGTLGKSQQRMIDVQVGPYREITLGQALTIYALDTDAQGRLDSGAMAVLGGADGLPVFMLDEPTRAKVIAKLSDNEKAFVDRVKREVLEDTLRPELFATLRRIKGSEPEAVDGYFPIRVAESASQLTQMDKVWTGGGDQPLRLENSGMTRTRQGGGKVLEIGDFLDVIDRHANRTARIIHLAEPVRDAANVLLTGNTRRTIAARMGADTVRRIERYLIDSGSGTPIPESRLDRISNMLTGNVSRALTQMNPMSWAVQVGGTSKLLNEFNAKDLAAGVKNLYSDRVGTLFNADPYLWHRYQNAGHSLRSGFTDTSPGQKAVGFRRSLAAAGQEVRSGQIRQAGRNIRTAIDQIQISEKADAVHSRLAYAAADAQVSREFPSLQGKAKDAKVTELARRAVKRTLNTADPVHGSGFQASAARSALMRPATAFSSDAVKSFNMIRQGFRESNAKGVKAAAVVALGAVVSGTIKGVYDYSLDKTGALGAGTSAGEQDRQERALYAAGMRMLRESSGTVFGADKLVDLVEASFAKYRGSPIQSPMLGVVDDMAAGVVDAARALGSAFDGKEPDANAKSAAERFVAALAKIAQGGSALAGLPVPPAAGIARRLARGASATHSADLLKERRELSAKAEKDLTPEQRARLNSLNRFYNRQYLRLRGQITKAKEAGNEEVAKQREQQLERIAKEWGKSSSLAGANP